MAKQAGPALAQGRAAAAIRRSSAQGPRGETLYAAEWVREPTNQEIGFYLPARTPGRATGSSPARPIRNIGSTIASRWAASRRASRLDRELLEAAWQFKVRPPRKNGQPMIGEWVRIRIEWNRAADGSSVGGIILAAAELVGQRLARGREIEADRIDAIALAGRRRAVGEDMALVRAAAGADDLVADHAVAAVADSGEMPVGERLGEAWPAGAAFELGAAVEQRQAAQLAGEDAGALLVEEDAAERRLGAMVEEDVALFVAEARRRAPASCSSLGGVRSKCRPCLFGQLRLGDAAALLARSGHRLAAVVAELDDAVARVDVDDRGLQRARFGIVHHRIADDDDEVAGVDEVRGGAVDADHPAAALRPGMT